ncbi:hypothetical protein ABID82_004264 [Methylobacterium sp. PvP062]|uniref:DUF1937 domain-containing protein n=1 Tax=Methylobacterium radiotolerans TaxID=31998 RepID=A0ABV2NL98_9HYPH|nr:MULTISPECIES: DUF1937 family protein [unclassified Methylobacterium]KZC01428.1 hypothetical protein AU375_02352 [Methylobacterium radiotolerans]MBP2496026.1 hypothetical protein [Methylobacterium sp. PvP105]MBP2504103.1 hypothetical protein [Methylobacterium sp. PvP109]MCX7333107.1 DUF1937 family protein [Hyphomicrobiales bacterium]
MIRFDNAVLRDALPKFPGHRIYMASPFTVYPTKEAAWRDACRAASALQAATVMAVYSPIADTYGMEAVGGSKLTHAEWMERDRAMLLACQHVVVMMLPGWEKSRGIRQEIAWAHEAKIPVWYVQPIGQHTPGSYLIASMEAGPPEGWTAFTLYHQDFMLEACMQAERVDPYAGETTLEDIASQGCPEKLAEDRYRTRGWLSGEDMIGAFYAK